MEKAIIGYRIVTSNDPETVTKKVQELVELGNQPFGPVSVSTSYSKAAGQQVFIYAQAVVNYKQS